MSSNITSLMNHAYRPTPDHLFALRARHITYIITDTIMILHVHCRLAHVRHRARPGPCKPLVFAVCWPPFVFGQERSTLLHRAFVRHQDRLTSLNVVSFHLCDRQPSGTLLCWRFTAFWWFTFTRRWRTRERVLQALQLVVSPTTSSIVSTGSVRTKGQWKRSCAWEYFEYEEITNQSVCQILCGGSDEICGRSIPGQFPTKLYKTLEKVPP